MFSLRLSVVALGFFACAVLAQEPAQVALTVVVMDQSGAFIPSARVIATDEATGRQFNGYANAVGQAVVLVDRGAYTLRIQASGFQAWEQKELRIQSDLKKDVTLPIANEFIGPTVVSQIEIPEEHALLVAGVPLVPIELFTVSSRRLRPRVRRF
jgi:hypothetical protein